MEEDDFEKPPLVPEDTTSYSSPSWVEAPKMSLEDNNVIEAAKLKPPVQVRDCEDIVSGSSAGSTPQFSGAPAKVQQGNQITVATKHDVRYVPVQSSSRTAQENFSEQASQIRVQNKCDVGGLTVQSASSSSSRSALESFAEMMAVQEAYYRALFDPDQDVPHKLMHGSPDAMKNHYASDVEDFYRNPANTFAPGPGKISDFSQTQHSGVGLNNGNSEFQFLLQQIKYPGNNSIRIMDLKGHVPAISADPYGSNFIQKKLGTATTGEILLVYKEIIPHLRTLVVDVFANYAIQKLLEHGLPFSRKELVGNLLEHVIDLSLHLYGYRVIQKAFELSEIDQQIEMAKEIGSNLLKCVCDQYANHVVQKCIECVPPQDIQFIYASLCGKAKMLSSHPHGYHVVQKMLGFCKDPDILHVFVSEIVECVYELSANEFGNYVVQYIVEHGGDRDRQIIVLKFAGRIVHMSYQEYSSKVIEKCLLYGSYHDRQSILTEILSAGGGLTADHLLGMMVHKYANYVVQKMIDTADEWQFNLIVDVVRRKVSALTEYAHGRDVIAQVERLLSARAGSLVSLAPPGS